MLPSAFVRYHARRETGFLSVVNRDTTRRLDLDGDGFLTEADLVACLPEIGVSADRRAAQTLLKAMDSRERGLGQATFKVRRTNTQFALFWQRTPQHCSLLQEYVHYSV